MGRSPRGSRDVESNLARAAHELVTLGRTLKQRAPDVLSYFDRPGTSNGPTEAINGRLEHLRGSALGFRNLTDYIARRYSSPEGSGRNYTLDYEEPVCSMATSNCSDRPANALRQVGLLVRDGLAVSQQFVVG